MAKIDSDIGIADKPRMANKLDEYARRPRITTADCNTMLWDATPDVNEMISSG